MGARIKCYKKALNVLIKLAKAEGFKEVSLDHNDISYVDWIENTLNTPNHIRIQGKYTDEIKTYLFLHELGHHELRKDWKQYKKAFPTLVKAEEEWHRGNNKYKRRNTFKVHCLEEEFKAWEIGMKIAKDLNIKINLDTWDKTKTKCLAGYIRWYGDRM